MKKLLLVVTAALAATWLATGVAFAEEWTGKSETKTVIGFQVELITPSAGVMVGENNLAVRLKDTATSQAVLRDSVRVDLSMDEADSSMNHGGMSSQKPVRVDLAAVKDVPGRYEGKVSLSDAGAWNVKVFTDPRGTQASASFKVSAESSGPNLMVIGAFALLILSGIGGVVALVKRSSAPAPAPAAPVQETTQA